jgi:hypothetical protein
MVKKKDKTEKDWEECMATFEKKVEKWDKKGWDNNCNTTGGGIWFGGFLGAIIYYFQNAEIFSDYLWGIWKAVLWPIYLIYYVLEFLNK